MHRWPTTLFLVTLSSVAVATDNYLAFDIKGTSLKELMALKITSLSKKQEFRSKAPAAVFVLTHEQIHRLGVTHIAEALRYVPGVEVARLEANKWSITIRGFNDRTANKLLVLIDGRSIYTPFYGGVLWEEKDVMLEDVDRIEVIRGPGGTLWGANAVNGVINIITKHSQATQGGVVKVGGGKEERGMVTSRYGWQTGAKSFARVYGKTVRRDEGGTGLLDDDHGEMNQIGFRQDNTFSPNHQFSVQGDLYQDQLGKGFDDITQTHPGQADSGGNVLMNWSLQNPAGLEHKVVAYYDETTLELKNIIDERRIWNIDYQLLQRWQRNEVVWGTGFRQVSDNIETNPAGSIQPESTTDQVSNMFIQDEIALTDPWHLIVGTKFEENDYSGTEWQPSVRTSYTMAQSMLWAAWSKAVRTQTRLETDIHTSTAPNFGEIFGPEYVTYKEIGWRYLPQQRWLLDFALYHADYTDLRSQEPTQLTNDLSGDVSGIEASISYQATEHWLLRADATHMEFDLKIDEQSTDTKSAPAAEGSSPQNTFQFASLYDIDAQWQINTYLRFVDDLPYLNVDRYCVFDVTVNWQPSKDWELQLVGRHLGDDEHPEWGVAPTKINSTTEVESDVALYATWRFE